MKVSVNQESGDAIGAGLAALVKEEKITVLNEITPPEKPNTKATDHGDTDTASLSRDIRCYLKTGWATKQEAVWDLDTNDLWQTLIAWLPDSSRADSLSDQLRELAQLYLSLQEAIKEHAPKDQFSAYFGQLDGALAAAVNRLTASTLKNTYSLFQSFGTNQMAAALRASILYPITGRILSAKELAVFWESISRANGGRLNKTEGAAPQTKESSAFSGRSIEDPRHAGYNLPQAGRAAPDRPASHIAYLKQAQEDDLSFQPSGTINEKPGIRATIVSGRGTIYPVRDMEMAERFLRYLNQGGNLFICPEIASKHEELLGFLQAVMGMKCCCFSSLTGVGRPMDSAIKTLLERMTEYYLAQAERYLAKTRPGAPFDRKVVNSMYHSVMKEFQKSSDAVRTLDQGLAFACAEFDKKRQARSPEKDGTFSRAEGFFHPLSSEKEELSDRQRVRKFLVKDWRRFCSAFDKTEKRPDPSLMEPMSPWAMSVNPDVRLLPSIGSLIWVGGAIAVGIIVCLIVF